VTSAARPKENLREAFIANSQHEAKGCQIRVTGQEFLKKMIFVSFDDTLSSC
jgi:hypothetical protein